MLIAAFGRNAMLISPDPWPLIPDPYFLIFLKKCWKYIEHPTHVWYNYNRRRSGRVGGQVARALVSADTHKNALFCTTNAIFLNIFGV
jgi:hypothetical protein